jgi:hypothetical protein
VPARPPADIETDREQLKDNVFRIKHGAEFLYDEGSSMISLEHVRGLLAAQTVAVQRSRVEAFFGSVPIVPGPLFGFCDFAGGGDYNAFALCDGNTAWIEDDWREKNTMATVGRFIALFRRLGLVGHQIGDDQGFGGALMDRLAERGYHLKRFRNGDPAQNKKDFFNSDAEKWSRVGKLIENRQIIIRDVKPDRLERLVKQLTSRQKIYDSDGRERLEPKDKMKARGLRSPDLADALVGATIMGPGSHRYAARSSASRLVVISDLGLEHPQE